MIYLLRGWTFLQIVEKSFLLLLQFILSEHITVHLVPFIVQLCRKAIFTPGTQKAYLIINNIIP